MKGMRKILSYPFKIRQDYLKDVSTDFTSDVILSYLYVDPKYFSVKFECKLKEIFMILLQFLEPLLYNTNDQPKQ